MKINIIKKTYKIHHVNKNEITKILENEKINKFYFKKQIKLKKICW